MTPPMRLPWRSAICIRWHRPGSGIGDQGSGNRDPDPRSRIPDPGLPIPDPRSRIPHPGKAPASHLAPVPSSHSRMIAFLRGRVLDKFPNRIILDVSGVGYEVHVPLSTYYEIGEAGSDVSLHVHTHV